MNRKSVRWTVAVVLTVILLAGFLRAVLAQQSPVCDNGHAAPETGPNDTVSFTADCYKGATDSYLVVLTVRRYGDNLRGRVEVVVNNGYTFTFDENVREVTREALVVDPTDFVINRATGLGTCGMPTCPDMFPVTVAPYGTVHVIPQYQESTPTSTGGGTATPEATLQPLPIGCISPGVPEGCQWLDFLSIISRS